MENDSLDLTPILNKAAEIGGEPGILLFLPQKEFIPVIFFVTPKKGETFIYKNMPFIIDDVANNNAFVIQEDPNITIVIRCLTLKTLT